MHAPKSPRVRHVVGIQADGRRAVLMGLMICLTIGLLVGGAAPSAAAKHLDDRPSPQRIYESRLEGVWTSDDGGTSWQPAGVLPSRPLALAAATRTSGLVFVGTESRGLLRSNDGGASWQAVDGVALSGGGVAPLAVTAVAIDPEDEQIVYAAVNIRLGTQPAPLTPLGIVVSVNGGRQWLSLRRAQLRDAPAERLEPVPGQPLAIVTANHAGRRTVRLELSPELLGMLQDRDPAMRASAARAIGLIGNPAALPGLLQVLADSDGLAGQRVAEAIGRIGDHSVNTALLNRLDSAPSAERSRAALALGLLKTEAAVPGLAALLHAGEPEPQRVAAQALAAIGTPEAMVALTAPLADQTMTSGRHAAMVGLESSGPPAVDALVAALNDSSPVVRANAAEMLGWSRSVQGLLDDVPSSRQQGRIVAGLTNLLADPDAEVRAQAAWALDESPMSEGWRTQPPLAALVGSIAGIASKTWTLAAMITLVLIALVATLWAVLDWRDSRALPPPGPT